MLYISSIIHIWRFNFSCIFFFFLVLHTWWFPRFDHICISYLVVRDLIVLSIYALFIHINKGLMVIIFMPISNYGWRRKKGKGAWVCVDLIERGGTLGSASQTFSQPGPHNGWSCMIETGKANWLGVTCLGPQHPGSSQAWGTPYLGTPATYPVPTGGKITLGVETVFPVSTASKWITGMGPLGYLPYGAHHRCRSPVVDSSCQTPVCFLLPNCHW